MNFVDVLTKIIADRKNIVKDFKKKLLKFFITYVCWALILTLAIMMIYGFSASSSHTKFNVLDSLVQGLMIGFFFGFFVTVYTYYKKFEKMAKTTTDAGIVNAKPEVVGEKKENKFVNTFKNTFDDLLLRKKK